MIETQAIRMSTKPSGYLEIRPRPGSLGYQFLNVLKAIFKPGRSRHLDKQKGKAYLHIYSKETMRKYTQEAFEFARFLKASYPACRAPEMLTPEICAGFIHHLVQRRLDGGTIG